MRIALALLALAVALPVRGADTRPGFGLDDLARLADVAEPRLSPDGRQVAYSLATVNAEADLSQTDLWRVGYDGHGRVRLTHTDEDSEWQPQWSPDGQWLAFLSDRGGEEALTQVWAMPAAGGEAHRLTDFPGGVLDYAWSPDSRRLAVIADDPEWPEGAGRPKNPPPIVTERYQFKEDGVGYLGARRRHLYLFELDSGKVEALTGGAHDEQLPAWSPDGRQIAFVSKRGADPDRHMNFDLYLVEARAGGRERQLTTFPGADLDPYWGARPAWSPDGRHIAYLQGGEDRWVNYAPWQLAVIDVASGEASLPAPIDRCFYQPRWSPDGEGLYALVEQSLVTRLAHVDLASGEVRDISHGDRFDFDFDVSADGRLVVLGGTSVQPYELAAAEDGGLRPLSDHNAFLRERRLAPAQTIRFTSADGTEVEGLLVRPLDYQPGKRYPTLLRLHGGPVYQFSHEFMAEWHYYAAQGYAVVAPNPRGSSGRGFDFARAIFADWGNKDVADVLAAVDHVVALGIADPDRLGVGGRSYGGILSHYVIASDTRFKAAVSGAGSSNMLGMYGADQYTREYELELGRPWRDRAAYERVSYPFLQAGRIVTPTQFYCAALDVNVPCLGAEQMYQALRSENVPAQLVVYPGEYHDMAVPSYLRDRLARSGAWYDRYLKR